uniref:Reverse transcriptase Ty1/copia-type domain-containing protein n=1 Tax=Solanum lycopersicum TaxID=4081 RepID=A0A3Q7IHX3_SOLLC
MSSVGSHNGLPPPLLTCRILCDVKLSNITMSLEYIGNESRKSRILKTMNYDEALQDKGAEKWIVAMKSEMESMFSNNVWDLNLGETSHIIGIKVLHDRKKRMLGLSQALYIDTILTRFSMHDSKKDFLPLRHGISLSKDQCPKKN